MSKSALDSSLDELGRVTALWREADLASKDFQTMLGRICYRHKKGLPLGEQIDQARDLLRRKGTLSILRNENPT